MEIINIDKDMEFVLDTQANEVEININRCRVVISDVSCSNKTINVNDGELDYCFIKKYEVDSNIKFNLETSNVNARVIDIKENIASNDYSLNLDSNSELEFSVASISRNSSSKQYKIKSNNLTSSSVKIDCFGVVEDKSLLKYDITSFIAKGAKGSRVNQNSKILLFDKESVGINNPILEIEENDVKANHGSSIGMIDEDTLFYLTSRGIEESEARNLVSLGKINYLIEEVRNEKIKEELLNDVIKGV